MRLRVVMAGPGLADSHPQWPLRPRMVSKVTAVSSTSVTLRSADGYSRTYQVTSSTMVNAQRDGIGSIKDGNQVIVAATVSGSTATAVRVVDATLLQRGFHRFFGAPPGASPQAAIP